MAEPQRLPNSSHFSSHDYKQQRDPERKAHETVSTIRQNQLSSRTAQSGKLETVPNTDGSIVDQLCKEETQKAVLTKDETTELLAVKLEELEKLLQKSEDEKEQLVTVINELRKDCNQSCDSITQLFVPRL